MDSNRSERPVRVRRRDAPEVLGGGLEGDDTKSSTGRRIHRGSVNK